MSNPIKDRDEKIGKINISWFSSLIVIAEFAVVLLTASLLSYFLEDRFKILLDMPIVVWMSIIGIVAGSIISLTVNRLIMRPIRKLRRAMTEVTNGNFKIHLDSKSHFGDIEEIYRSFNLMTSELAATEMLSADFVSNVSHEIKTPINAIEGYAMLLQDNEGVDEEGAEYIEKILFSTKRLSELVGNILLLSKIDSQSIETKKEKFLIDEQIRQSIMLLESKWMEKDIEFDVELSYTEYIGNSALLMHVWNNLIGNAIKFSPFGGTVRVRLLEKDERVIFTVDDCGPGIDESVKKRIFDKFYQADSSHKEEGNGLGLALVKKITDMAGGQITTENLTDGGCRFTVSLPKEK